MTNIYIGNLDFTTPEDQLRTLFAAYGAVETVTIVMDRDTDQPRGFAFVEMTSASEAQDAIHRLNGSVLDERALSVNEARPKLYHYREHESLTKRCCTLSSGKPGKGIVVTNVSQSDQPGVFNVRGGSIVRHH